MCVVGPDKNLYIQLGQPYNVPGKDKLGMYTKLGIGGIIRMDRDGKNREIYATGLRNPLVEAQARAAAGVFRPELFDAATGNNALPESADPIGLKFGPAFDSGNLQAYVDALTPPASDGR